MAIPQSHSWLHGVQFFYLATCSKLSKLSNCGLAGHHGFSAAFPWNISWEGCRDGVLHRLTVFNGTRFSRSLCYRTKPASSVRSMKKTVKWESISNQCDFEFQFLIQFWLDFCFQFCLTLYAGSGLTEEDGTSRMSLFAQGFKECLVSATMRRSGNLLFAVLHRIPGLLFVKAIAGGSWQLRAGLDKKQWRSRKGILICYIQ